VSDPAARVRDLLALYRRTHYGVVLTDGSDATLRIGALPPQAIADWIGAEDSAVYLTACNPRSQALSDADNAARMGALRERLHDANARWLEGRAGIPGEPWSESSLLVAGIDIASADRLARDFGQDAALAVTRRRRVALRLYRDDWRAHADDGADIEWAALA